MVALLSKPRLIQIEETKLIKLLNEFVELIFVGSNSNP